MKLLLNSSVEPDELARVRAAAPGASVMPVGDRATLLAEIVDADAVYGPVSPEAFALARRLRWVHSFSVGVDHLLYPEMVASDVVITNTRGIRNHAIANHAFALILAFNRGILRSLHAQRERRWEPFMPEHLAGQTLLVVGMGEIGREIARRGATFQMRVLGVDPVTRHSDVAERIVPPNALVQVAPEADYVVVACPLTPETQGMIGRAAFAAMKPTARLINIARGPIVDEAALTEALRAGAIAGAGLDVCEREPLPPDSPLWTIENVILTPHVAGGFPERQARVVDLLCDNLRRFIAGEPLVNVVDKRRGF